MASSSHLNLSAFIKLTHKTLREQSKVVGSGKAWENHCKNEDNLKQYAQAMIELATNYWEDNNKKGLKASSRVCWIHDYCQMYFYGEVLGRQRLKECEIGEKIGLNDLKFSHFNKLKMLDVGSCYNPFSKYDYDVVAIDIAPAINNVIKGDFLNIDLVEKPTHNQNLEITELQIESFDTVVFSLLLEYFPDPKQRLLCCQKAYDLLKFEGLLIVITPDSKHVSANAKIMKSWRCILAEMGFARIKYEKLPHIHCIVFRKSCHKSITQRWMNLHKHSKFFDEIVIPQDFIRVHSNSVEDVEDRTAYKCDVQLFDELPNFLQ